LFNIVFFRGYIFMSWNNKVVWSEGVFLRPQLFQQQDRYFEAYMNKRIMSLTPFFWGFSEYAIDSDALRLGNLVVAKCAGVFPDGTPFEIPAQSPPPEPMTLLPEHLGKVICLAVSIRRPNSEEMGFEGSDTLARFKTTDADVIDVNAAVGAVAAVKTIQVGQLRTRLMPESEVVNGWVGMPIMRLVSLGIDKVAVIDELHIPPLTSIRSNVMLWDWLVQIHTVLIQRRDSLADRLTGSTGSTQSSEISDFLILQMFNRYEPLFAHLLSGSDTSLETAYVLLRSLASEFATFVRSDTRKGKNHSSYIHNEPSLTFKVLVDDCRELLNNVLARSAQNITLSAGSYGQFSASLDPNEIKSYLGLIIAVTAQMGTERIATQISSHAKVAPTDRLADVVRSHLPGIGLSVLPVAPRQLPFNAGYVYFQLDPHGPLWEHFSTHGGLGLHIASEMPGLKVELWGIK
jgi:type VI secretion system protein ImpJ